MQFKTVPYQRTSLESFDKLLRANSPLLPSGHCTGGPQSSSEEELVRNVQHSFIWQPLDNVV